MLVAALGFVWMAVGSMGLELPLTQGDPATEGTRVSANLLISTYLILTFCRASAFSNHRYFICIEGSSSKSMLV